MKPLIATAIFGVLMMFSALTVKEKKSLSGFASILLLILTCINVWELVELAQTDTAGVGVHLFSNMLHVSTIGLWFNTLMVFITLIYVLISKRQIEKVGMHVGEYYALFFFILTGVYLLTSFNNLLILFLGIELVSIPQYILAGSDKRNLKSSEAALKYFLMGAFSTGILLMGMALLYGGMGTFYIDQMNFNNLPETLSILPITGVLIMVIALGFKVSAAPMHFWTPDVYDGAPTPFTAFMSTIIKAAIFFGFVAIFKNAFYGIHDSWMILLSIITALTLVVGNFTAVYQQSVKRMLAYSSIAQAGFMLFAVMATNATGLKAIIIYGSAYSLATIGVFAVLMRMKDYTYDGFNGLAKKQPFLAFVTTICLLSLAGIPMTAGFFAKYYALTGLLQQHSGYLWLVIFALVMAAISAYYYFKVIIAMYFKTGDAELAEDVTTYDKAILSLIVIGILFIGIFPDALLCWF